MKSVRMTVVAVVIAFVVVACGGGGSTAPEHTKQWAQYNVKRTAYTPAANAVAKSVADRITAAGIACNGYADYDFSLTERPYRLQGLPIALGAGNCSVGTEEVLIEVFGAKHPNATDFVAVKRGIICARAKKLGRLPDGSSGFDGIPYIMAPDQTWIIEPDTFKQTREIAAKLGRPTRDMCVGIK